MIASGLEAIKKQGKLNELSRSTKIHAISITVNSMNQNHKITKSPKSKELHTLKFPMPTLQRINIPKCETKCINLSLISQRQNNICSYKKANMQIKDKKEKDRERKWNTHGRKTTNAEILRRRSDFNDFVRVKIVPFLFFPSATNLENSCLQSGDSFQEYKLNNKQKSEISKLKTQRKERNSSIAWRKQKKQNQ